MKTFQKQDWVYFIIGVRQPESCDSEDEAEWFKTLASVSIMKNEKVKFSLEFALCPSDERLGRLSKLFPSITFG